MAARAFNIRIMPVRIVVYTANRRATTDYIFMAEFAAVRTVQIFANGVEMDAGYSVRIGDWRFGNCSVLTTARAYNSMHRSAPLKYLARIYAGFNPCQVLPLDSVTKTSNEGLTAPAALRALLKTSSLVISPT